MKVPGVLILELQITFSKLAYLQIGNLNTAHGTIVFTFEVVC